VICIGGDAGGVSQAWCGEHFLLGVEGHKLYFELDTQTLFRASRHSGEASATAGWNLVTVRAFSGAHKSGLTTSHWGYRSFVRSRQSEVTTNLQLARLHIFGAFMGRPLHGPWPLDRCQWGMPAAT
jgi:hypothetical protein